MSKRKRPTRSRHDRLIEGHPLWNAIRDAQTVPDGRVLCPLCDRLWPWEFSSELHIDHIIPLADGGDEEPDNLQLVCGSCNWIKKDRTQEEARAACLEARTMSRFEWLTVVARRGARAWSTKNREKEREKSRRFREKRKRPPPLREQPYLKEA